MASKNSPTNPLADLRLHHVRGQAVMLDGDLAALYGVSTTAFNQAVKRNLRRFPPDSLYRLTRKEHAALISQSGISKPGRGGRRKLPWVFTGHGAIMAATILNSSRAVAMSAYVVRAFVRMRRELLTSAALEARLARIEKTLLVHDVALRDLYRKIKPLLLPPPEPPDKEMGYHTMMKQP